MKKITGLMFMICILLTAAGGVSEGYDLFYVGADGMPARG